MARSHNLLMALCAIVLVMVSPSVWSAELRQDVDYIAIVLEAEEHENADERWVLTEPGTPQQEQDPDGNHSDQAVGMAYLELLPDIRVTHDDPFDGPPRGFWGRAGEGPIASYTVNFPEPGRYYVHARVFATGYEDNGLHVGLNGDWPESGTRLQICSALEQAWRWTSAQRYSGGRTCGTEKTIWITVEEAGEQSFQISAREDGFELDRVMLIKDLSDNTRVCAPVRTEADTISCRNGSLDLSDDVVDLAVELTTSSELVVVGETVELSATVYNADELDIATGVEISYEYSSDEWEAVSQDERCEVVGEGVVCQIEELSPTQQEQGETFILVLEPKSEGILSVLTRVSSVEEDDDNANDSSQLDVEVRNMPETGQLYVDFSAVPEDLVPGQPFPMSFSVFNDGSGFVPDGTLTIELPTQFEIVFSDERCTLDTSQLICELGYLAADGSVSVDVSLSGDSAGLYTLSALASSSNSRDDSDTVVIELIAAEPAPDVSDTDNSSATTDEQTDTDGRTDTDVLTTTDAAMGTDGEPGTATASGAGALGILGAFLFLVCLGHRKIAARKLAVCRPAR